MSVHQCYVNLTAAGFEDTRSKKSWSERKQDKNRGGQAGKNSWGNRRKEGLDRRGSEEDPSFGDRRNVEHKHRDVQRHDSHEHGNIMTMYAIIH